MIEINIVANNSKEYLEQIQDTIGGTMEEHWGECILNIDNKIATGSIRFIPFDWGVKLMDFDLIFFEDIELKIEPTDYNPIFFMHVLNGNFEHRLVKPNQEKIVEQFHSLITSAKSDGLHYFYFPKNLPLKINLIKIVRKNFLKKRTSQVSTLNKKLQEVFVDTNHRNRFVHHRALDLKIADHVKKLIVMKGKDMMRILKIEAKVYEILSLHMQQHDNLQKGVPLPTSLLKSELKKVRQLGEKILKNPSKNYSLEQLSSELGLSQAKLQDGFKFLYTKTVTEYIRHVRLEAARELIKTSDMNISEIVYTIGFTSRSYFSKIFKEKYEVTPNKFKKRQIKLIAV